MLSIVSWLTRGSDVPSTKRFAFFRSSIEARTLVKGKSVPQKILLRLWTVYYWAQTRML